MQLGKTWDRALAAVLIDHGTMTPQPDGSLIYELAVSAKTAVGITDLDVVEVLDGMPCRVRVTRKVPEEAAADAGDGGEAAESEGSR